MVQLPASIEAYLQEAGFSPTELLVLKRLLEGEALTLRELALKTGKSTGVLDQASKKLIEKRIITKTQINDVQRYGISSIDAVKDWMSKDMDQRHAVLERKQQDFEAFLTTVQHENGRPDMEFFEGFSGMQRAFAKLLDGNHKEWLQFMPATVREEDDPLAEFRVDLFRKRRNAKTFMRSIAPDNSLGRRYQSRDVFEYRKTLLVPEAEFPVSFEKYIVGDTVACFEFDTKKASFIRFPQLSDEQRHMFEMFWTRAGALGSEASCPVQAATPATQEADTETRVLSGLREFFVSGRSLVMLGLFTIVSALITFGLYQSIQWLNFQRMQEQVVAIARTGALQMDVADLNELREKDDYKKPAWNTVAQQLIDIKTSNSDIMYVYVFRKSTSGDGLEFIADADSLNPYANIDDDPSNDIDMNGDGTIDGSPTGGDYQSWPGQPYSVAPKAAFESFNGLSASDFYEDQWGKVVTGYAPIKDTEGNVVAVLAVDKKAAQLNELTRRAFVPFYVFFALLILFIILRLAAFHRPLVRELLLLSKTKRVLVAIAVFSLIAGAVTWGLYASNSYLNLQRVREKAIGIATTGALLFDVDDIDTLRTEADITKPQYAKVIETLNKIRSDNSGVTYAYIMRPTDQRGIWEFVADADSLDPFVSKDLSGDGMITEEDHLSPPGEIYDSRRFNGGDNLQALVKPISIGPEKDQWGTFVTGWAPIKDKNGKTVAVFGVDRQADQVKELTLGIFNPFYTFIGIFVLFIFIRFAVFHHTLAVELLRLSRTKKFLIAMALCAFIALVVTYGMYRYTLGLMKEEMSNRLLSIVATAAPEIAVSDMDAVHIAGDMQKPEYQRLYSQLNEIRDRNSDLHLQYAYIMRPSEYDGMYEFVADADSNYFLPDPNDQNALEVVPPGTQYAVAQLAHAKALSLLLKKPLTSTEITTDKWGTYLSASAPIFNESGVGKAILGVDMDISEFYERVNNRFKPLIWFIGVLTSVFVLRTILICLRVK